MQNLTKWVNLSFLASSVLAWGLLREVFLFGFEPLGWNRFGWLIPPSDIAGIGVGLALFLFLIRSEKSNIYTSEVFAELSKVTWPKPKEAALSTGVVAVMVMIATLCVLFFDFIWRWVSESWIY